MISSVFSSRRLTHLVFLSISVSVPFVALTAHALEKRLVIEPGVCDVLDLPDNYVNKEIVLRGSIFRGVDHMNISDSRCPGRALELAVDSEKVFNGNEFQEFLRKINKYGQSASATVSGKLVKKNNVLIPYVLYIEKIEKVVPDS